MGQTVSHVVAQARLPNRMPAPVRIAKRTNASNVWRCAGMMDAVWSGRACSVRAARMAGTNAMLPSSDQLENPSAGRHAVSQPPGHRRGQGHGGSRLGEAPCPVRDPGGNDRARARERPRRHGVAGPGRPADGVPLRSGKRRSRWARRTHPRTRSPRSRRRLRSGKKLRSNGPGYRAARAAAR